jgi:hypothetical protein
MGGANLGRAVGDGTSALLVAAARGDVAMIDALLAAGVDATRRNKRGETALGVAIAAGHAEVQARLRARGASDAGTTAKRERSPELRWLSDAMRRDVGVIHAASDVDRLPAFKAGNRPEVIHGRLTTAPLMGSSTVADPMTGQIYTTRGPVGVLYNPAAPSPRPWAVVSFVVETDGTTTGADLLMVSSYEYSIAVEKELGTFVFESGEREGRPVRTRIAVVLDMERYD